MNSKTKMWLTLGIGLIIIAVTLVLFLVGFSGAEKTNIHWLALAFMLVSELMLIAGSLLLPVYIQAFSAAMFRAGVISTLIIYCIITALLAVFANRFFAGNLSAFISTQVIVLGVVAVIIISLIMNASNVKAADEQLGSGASLKNSENIAFSLKSNTSYQEFAGMLGMLYEELKYSDKATSIAELDQTINSSVIELSEELNNDPEITKEMIEEKVNQIILNIKERNRAVMQLKK